MILIDNSMLGDILSCSTRAWVKYVQHKHMRVQEGDGHERMAVGTLFHQVFAHSLMQWMDEANLAWFAQAYQETFPEGVTTEKYELHNLLLIAETWLRSSRQHFRGMDVVDVEQYLEMPLSPWVTYFGTVDAVVRDQHGLWIVESKTTGWLTEEKKRFWTRGSQGMGYWELVKHKYGEEPRGVIWNVVEIGKVPPWDGNVHKKCQKHGVKYLECQTLHVSSQVIGPVGYSQEQREVWRYDVLTAAEKFAQLERSPLENIMQEGRFTYPGCATCPFTDWCWAGRPVQYMTSMMEDFAWPVKAKEPV